MCAVLYIGKWKRVFPYVLLLLFDRERTWRVMKSLATFFVHVTRTINLIFFTNEVYVYVNWLNLHFIIINIQRIYCRLILERCAKLFLDFFLFSSFNSSPRCVYFKRTIKRKFKNSFLKTIRLRSLFVYLITKLDVK